MNFKKFPSKWILHDGDQLLTKYLMSHNRIIVLEDEEIALVVPEISDLEVMTRGINHLENAKYVNLAMPRGVMGYKAEEEYLSDLISKS